MEASDPEISRVGRISTANRSIRSSRLTPNQPESPRTPTATKIATTQCVVAHPDLAAVVDAWPDLPDGVKVGIVALVRSCSGREKVDSIRSARESKEQ
jgi:hypothetical protein